MKKIIALLCTILMIFSCVTIFADDEDTSYDIDGSKKASPTELDQDQRETTVTLSLPSGEYQNKVDIVLVIDSSSSTDSGKIFKESALNLFNSIIENNPDINLKVGIILYTGRGNDAIAYLSDNVYTKLVEYNDETKDLFVDSFDIPNTMEDATFKQKFGRGSSPHGGLDMADEWLADDGDVDDSHKYVVLMTDGKGYIWNNDQNEPTTIYSQYYQWAKNIGADNVANGGKVSISQIMGYNKKGYPLDVLDPTNHSYIVFYDSYEELYALTDEELTGVNEWDQICRYAIDTTIPDGTVEKHPTTNGVEIFGNKNYQYWYEWKPADDWKDIKYLEMNPYAVIDNGDGTYTFDTETINPLYYQYHFDCMQKGLYKAGHLWTEMGKKYNCAVMTYKGKSETGGGLELVVPFKNWIRQNSQYGADESKPDDVQKMFTNIDNSIRYMVNKGVVTDIITSDFDLKEMDNPFTIETENEGVFSVTLKAENDWVFGEADEESGLYPYEVTYDPSAKTIVWTLNVPVENSNQVSLSYPLEIREDAETGPYDTNVSAVLEYTTSDGKKGSYTFEIPQVTYSKKYTITYILDGGNYNGDEGPLKFVYPEGEVIEIHDAPVKDGYVFKYWEGSQYDPGDSYTVTEDHTFTAIWEKEDEPTPVPEFVFPHTGIE